MDAKTLNFFKEKLERNREEAIKTLDKIWDTELEGSLREYTKELSIYDNHPADIGSETYERDKNIALKKQKMHSIAQMDRALDRIEKGKYGICAYCGVMIAKERLKVQPEAELCTECSKGTEPPRERIMGKRPVEEEVLSYPYNTRGEDMEKQTMFDGEDSWQAVARYNRREDDPSNSTGDDQDVWDEIPAGLVEDIDRISNRYYKNKLYDD